MAQEEAAREAADASDDIALANLAAGATAAVVRAEAEAQELSDKLAAAEKVLDGARDKLASPVEGPSEEELLEEMEAAQKGSKKNDTSKKKKSVAGDDDEDSDEDDEDDDNRILSIFEAKAKLRRELIRALREEKQQKVRDKYIILNENLRNHGQVSFCQRRFCPPATVPA